MRRSTAALIGRRRRVSTADRTRCTAAMLPSGVAVRTPFQRGRARRVRPLAGVAMCCLIGLANPSDRLFAPTTFSESDGRASVDLDASHAVTGPTLQQSIDGLIELYSEQHGLRVALVRALVQAESSFDPRAVSSKGAKGLMQLMPLTASSFGVSDPFDPSENLRAGTAYLRHLLDRYHGDERRALAAYAGGPSAGDRLGQRSTVPAGGSTPHVPSTSTVMVAAVDVTADEASLVERPMTPDAVVH
ncbi:MAG: lytic transglycosylase domain-containing protein [Vicinamibacterales bacterium]